MKILLNTGTGAKMLDSENIINCKADGKYTKVYFNNFIGEKECFNSSFNITELEKLLPEDVFFKCHRSVLINLKCFDEYINPTNRIVLTCGTVITLARSRKPMFKAKLLKFIEKCNLTEI